GRRARRKDSDDRFHGALLSSCSSIVRLNRAIDVPPGIDSGSWSDSCTRTKRRCSMPWVPEDEPRVTTGEAPETAERRKNARPASELPGESEVTFLDDEPDSDEETPGSDERGGSR